VSAENAQRWFLVVGLHGRGQEEMETGDQLAGAKP